METVRTSLPYAYDLIAALVGELRDEHAEFADNHTPPPSEKRAWPAAAGAGQRRDPVEPGAALRRDPRLQNCHRVAVFRPEAQGGETHTRFTSLRSQILNQSPEFRDC